MAVTVLKDHFPGPQTFLHGIQSAFNFPQYQRCSYCQQHEARRCQTLQEQDLLPFLKEEEVHAVVVFHQQQFHKRP